MTDQKFKEVIYGPYKEAWTVIKLLQEATDDNPQLSEVLRNYIEKVDLFSQQYEGNEFAMLLKQMMLSADDTVLRIGRS